jgi:hypothetical protein
VTDREITARMLKDTAHLVATATAAGLVVTAMRPYGCHGRTTCWTVALWTPAGGLWMEASHESKASIMDGIALWGARDGKELPGREGP